jgi:SPOR domain
MANRYQGRPFPADDDYDRDAHASSQGDSDPLAELARLIGQTDPFGGMGRANLPVQPHARAREPYRQPSELAPDDTRPAGRPAWMQRVSQQESSQQEYPDDPPNAARPTRYPPVDNAVPEPDYRDQPAFAAAHQAQARDPSRYDDVLYGQPDPDARESEHEPAYADDSYYQEHDEVEPHVLQKRRGGTITVVLLLALAVVGTGAAFGYRTYFGAARSGEPPIIRADAGPTKIVPTSSDGVTKVPDRLPPGDGAERLVSREETPVDINAKSGARIVSPGLNATGGISSAQTGFSTSAPPPSAGDGTLSNSEPRKIKTLSVRGDQTDASAAPVAAAPPSAAKSAAVPRSSPSATNANASSGNAPLSLAPKAAPPAPERVAAANPVQIVPSAGGGGSGGYLVQVSSQLSEADAQASFRALQGKFPTVLGSRSPLIKRADVPDKGVRYRTMVGPFGSSEEASQFCGSLKSAGGQCIVQRN